MKIVDTRTGEQIRVGELLHRAPGDGLFLHSIRKKGLRVFGDFTIFAPTIPGGKWRREVELQRRFIHPDFFLQDVAFIPS